MPDRDTTAPTMPATVPIATPRPGQVFAGASSTALEERASTIPPAANAAPPTVTIHRITERTNLPI